MDVVETLIQDGSPEPPKRIAIDKIMGHFSKSTLVDRYLCNICASSGRTKYVAGIISFNLNVTTGPAYSPGRIELFFFGVFYMRGLPVVLGLIVQ